MKVGALLLLAIASVLFISCGKDYSVENVFTSGGQWSFIQGANNYSGTIDTSYIEIRSRVKILHFDGKSNAGTENFHISLYTVDSFKVGTYKASLSQATLSYVSGSNVLYNADGIAGEFIVTITNISGNYISGQFSGAAYDVLGNVTNLTSGSFYSTINLSGTSNGNLGVAAGLCTPVAFGGTYTHGVSMNNSNGILIQVNVTATGSYNISTNTVNGVTFTGLGTFTSTGVHSVVLTATGTPVSAGSQAYTISYKASSCTFSLIYN